MPMPPRPRRARPRTADRGPPSGSRGLAPFGVQTHTSGVLCPYCAEPLDAYVDPGGGESQRYVEDCAVCCRPITFVARLDDESGEYVVEAFADR